MIIPSGDFSKNSPPASNPLGAWLSVISSSLATLHQLAGATEHEFLQIGIQMQGVYQDATTLSRTAHHLVEVAAGERIQTVMERLRQILKEMEAYLEQVRIRNAHSCTTLDKVQALLQQVSEPLEGFKKISKQLYILEVSIKIESTYLEAMESDFVNLALDVRKLSLQIKEKAIAIYDHRQLLSSMITRNIDSINAAKSNQDATARLTISNTAASIAEVELAIDRFSHLGTTISAISDENSTNISGIVQSMQFHDIYRQQVEHVIEALEGLLPSLADVAETSLSPDDLNHQALISKVGDACELQEAQLQFASAALYRAVTTIVTDLRDIGVKQKQMTRNVYTQTGAVDASSTSFIDAVSQDMTALTNLLSACAEINNEMAGTMQEMTDRVDEIADLVTNIEDIGQEIILIALNARIKATCTGTEGAALSALSEEIGQLSHEAVERTNLITVTLTEIHSSTGVLSKEVNGNKRVLSENLADMKTDLDQLLTVLHDMGTELRTLLSQIQHQVNALTLEIECITGSIDVHERTRAMADDVLHNLRQIFGEARRLCPASPDFKEDLRRMAERYTMDSERRIHEEIAQKNGVTLSLQQTEAAPNLESTDSEFGDNVDLF